MNEKAAALCQRIRRFVLELQALCAGNPAIRGSKADGPAVVIGGNRS
jgi:hypothetical protein